MQTEQVTILGKSLSMPTQHGPSAGDGVSPKVQESEEPVKEADLSQVKDLTSNLQDNLKIIHDVGVQFSVHGASGQVMVAVVDETTGEVIREIPQSEMLNLATRLEEMVGLIFDQKG